MGGTRRFAGCVAVVTGAGSGIGRLAAQRFAAEGAEVAAADINPETAAETVETIRASGGTAIAVTVDVGRAAEVRAMIEAAVARFGRIDVLYNHAGIIRAGSVVDLDEADWDLVLATNLKSVYLGCKYAIPHMIRQGRGAIVNTGGTFGFYGKGDLAAYCAAKGAVHNLTKQMALDYMRHGIRINCVCPGFIDTPINRDVPPEVWARIVATQLDGRAGRPEEVVNAALFLASDEASFISGTTLLVDGGQLSGRHGA